MEIRVVVRVVRYFAKVMFDVGIALEPGYDTFDVAGGVMLVGDELEAEAKEVLQISGRFDFGCKVVACYVEGAFEEVPCGHGGEV